MSALIRLLKEKHGYAISPCKKKTKIHAKFKQTGVKFAVYFIKIVFYKKSKSLSTIFFIEYSVC